MPDKSVVILETGNVYSCPIDENCIQEIIKNSPTHKLYRDKSAVYDLTSSVDFLCKEGTPVKAALNGEVVAVVDEVRENIKDPDLVPVTGGLEDRTAGNFVLIKHDNKEFSQYCHLKHKSICVKNGQDVKRGEVIGYSGDTGLSFRPHLHFHVLKFTNPEPARDFETLKIRWVVDE